MPQKEYYPSPIGKISENTGRIRSRVNPEYSKKLMKELARRQKELEKSQKQ